MAATASSTVLVFGDQSVSTHSFFKDLFARSIGSASANTFLEDANATLRREIAELPVTHKKLIPSFSSIQELSNKTQASRPIHAGIEGALLVAAQLTHYIRYIYNHSKHILV